MLNNHNSFSFNPDFMDVDGRRVYAHLQDLSSDSEHAECLTPPSYLEFVFQFIRSSFLYVDGRENTLLPQHIEDKAFYPFLFFVLSLPFKDESDNAQVEQWNELVERVSRDFEERKGSALRGLCSYEQLDFLVRDQIENFEYEDRLRLDPEKLINLVLFVYDYCMLTMRESRLHRHLDMYVDGVIEIRKKRFFPPLRVCASIDRYEPYEYEPVEGEPWPFENYMLPKVELAPVIRNPHASDSNCAAMFADLMHKFFLSFGLQKKGKSEWAKAERMLIYELLRLFGLCKSNLPAEKSKYVTTVLNDYGNYFSACNLRTWIREEQAYSYLMCCSVDDLVRKSQQISEPFLTLEDYLILNGSHVVEEQVNTSEEKVINAEPDDSWRVLDMDEYPPELREAWEELAGRSLVITHSEYYRIAYASVESKDFINEENATVDSRLDYVMTLIDSAYEYITFLPTMHQYIVMRNDPHDPMILSRLLSSLGKDLLNRMDSIPRGNFDREKVMGIIKDFHQHLPSKEERLKFNEDKFYVLFLFIYDYVYLTFKEATISPHLKKFIYSNLVMQGKNYTSTILIDDMLMAYLENLYSIEYSRDKSKVFQVLAPPRLYVPSQKNNYPIELESCNVKNMVAMFYDLFVHFFKSLGLSKRSDVKFLSDQESMLVAELAKCCGICETENANSVRAMFMSNKDYFEKSSLQHVIRENEYHSLMMNKMSDVLFGSKSTTE